MQAQAYDKQFAVSTPPISPEGVKYSGSCLLWTYSGKKNFFATPRMPAKSTCMTILFEMKVKLMMMILTL